MSRGTPCSCTNTVKRIRAACSRAFSPGRRSITSLLRKYNLRHEKPLERRRGGAVQRIARPARVHLAPARPRTLARAPWWRQHLGQAAREGSLRGGARGALCEEILLAQLDRGVAST